MFFKKKSRVVFPEVVFSKETLTKALSDLLDKLSAYKQDECMKDVREIIQIGKNAAILDSSMAIDESQRIRFQAKIEAYRELQDWIEVAVNRVATESRAGKGPMRGALRTVSRNMTASAV